jgi:hypothetical protein
MLGEMTNGVVARRTSRTMSAAISRRKQLKVGNSTGEQEGDLLTGVRVRWFYGGFIR